MGIETEISWTDHTFNPWWGCVKVSPACDRCYAETFSKRVGFAESGSKFPIWGKQAGRRFFAGSHWSEPLKWDKNAAKEGVRKRVFCGSMCDVMEEYNGTEHLVREGLEESRRWLYSLIERTANLDWLLLTKRPQNFRRFLPKGWLANPRPNVWGMATVESQEFMWRAKELCQTPFAIRGISAEPLLGPLDFTAVDYRNDLRQSLVKFARETPSLNLLTGEWFDGWDSGEDGARLDWIIVGGESGAGARPSHPDWFRSIRDQCVRAGIAFHHKQNGEWASVSEVAGAGAHRYFEDGATVRRVGKKAAGRLLDGRTWDEMPRAAD